MTPAAGGDVPQGWHAVSTTDLSKSGETSLPVSTRNGILLVSELFPPAVGGTAEVFGNVYARLGDVATTVLTDGSGNGDRSVPSFKQIHERRMATGHWGLLHPRGLAHHLGIARAIRRAAGDGIAAIHCGRVLPEGLSALLASTSGAPPYFCWAHGEELGYIDSSRELRRLAATVYGRARGVLANSHNTAALLARRGVPSSAIHVIRLGVEHDRFRPSVPGAEALRRTLAPDGQILLLTVGRLQRRKGHDLVLEALKRWGEAARRIRYVIVGDGEERQRLEQMVRDFDLGSVVVFAGKAPSSTLPQYYGAADLFIHPNRVEGADFEGFGIVFLEAAAAGLPVIAGRSGGVPEAVLDQVTGLLVSGTDSEELQRAMTDLISNPARRREMGEAGRARVLAEFTWQRAADRVAELHADFLCQ